MRRRDIHAIAFCGVTIPLLFVGVWLVAQSLLIAVCVTAAYTLLICTRPRMIRVFRRLTGRRISEWGGYYEE